MTFEELKQKAHSLPLLPGVYLMSDERHEIIYVGKAKALRNRVSQYFQESTAHTSKTRLMVSQIDSFDVIVADSEFEALVLECALIKRHQPRYNILLKDDKGYPYLRLSKEAYPRFSIAGKPADDGARYFGPFGGRRNTQDLIDALRGALRLPDCNHIFPRDIGKERPCLNHHMGKCDGYCRSVDMQEQHRAVMRQAVQLLEGKFSDVEKELGAQMLEAAEDLAFEKAAMLRDRLQAIELLGKRQKVVTGRLTDMDVLGIFADEVRCAVSVLHFQAGELAGKDTELLQIRGEALTDILSAFLTQYYIGRSAIPGQILLPLDLEDEHTITRLLSEDVGRRVQLVTPQRGAKVELIRLAEANAREECRRVGTKEERSARLLVLLEEMLELEEPPARIEAYDISNTGAANIVGAMTVFIDGKAQRSKYRCFKLRELQGPDDYAAMDQVLRRRFRHEIDGDARFADAAPNLLLMDGGREHAGIAERVLRDLGLSIPVFGMVKDNRHRTRALVDARGKEVSIQAVPALFAMIGQMQEETHKTAVDFHQRQRIKANHESSLQLIVGVGEVRRRALLKHFKSVKAIRTATLVELEAVVPKKTAQAVYEHYRKEEE